MTGRRDGRAYECVVVDVNTQRDFCNPEGACPVANVATLIPALRHMIAWVKWNRAPMISSIESHRPSDLLRRGQPACCLDGTGGQRKINFTIFRQRTWIEVDNTLACPMDLFRRYQQVIFRKRTDDLLANPKADRFFTQVPTDAFILFGVSLEGSVKALTLSLLARDKVVAVVADACGYWSKGTADLAIRQIIAKGARIITLDELLHRRLDRRWPYSASRCLRLRPDFVNWHDDNRRRKTPDRSNPVQPQSPDRPPKTGLPRSHHETRDTDT